MPWYLFTGRRRVGKGLAARWEQVQKIFPANTDQLAKEEAESDDSIVGRELNRLTKIAVSERSHSADEIVVDQKVTFEPPEPSRR